MLDPAAAARSFWSGTITFGLVSIPVAFFAANRPGRVSLRMLAPDGTPLRRKYYNPETGRDLSNDDLVRGYEIEKRRYVVVSDEELDRLAPEKSRDIDLRRFVPADSIPPRYFERAYFLAPAGPSQKAYRLLAVTMEQTRRAGVATFVMRGREYLVAIFAEDGILRAETLRFEDEVRKPADVGLPAVRRGGARTVRRLEHVISRLAQDDLGIDELTDQKTARLLEVAERKRSQGKAISFAKPQDEPAPVIDILTALKQSIERRRRGAGRSGNAETTDELESLSRSDLYDRAKALDIPGRSGMRKQQLIEAIRRTG